MNCLYKKWVLLIICICLCACTEREQLAPVTELRGREVNSHARQHTVERGETLYAIAFRYDQDYRQLAINNYLNSPYTLRVGQVIRLKPTGNAYPQKRSTPSARRPIIEATPSYHDWQWPIRGRIASTYAPSLGKKGIDIAGRKHDKIHAARSGIVAYAGNGLKGYGNLIIIKHDHHYLTAYGNNLKNLVKEGQHIKAGQAIAEIGVVDRRFFGVHFEIRKAGKPVNPLNYLQNS
jgi:lipoprotein NlpD